MIAEAVAKATAPLLERIAGLEAELAKAKKNSSNSSKQPSSDMVKPPKPSAKDRKKRKRGGQPGHPQHVRPIFPPEAVNHIELHTLDCCPECGGSLRLAKRPPDVLQQIEIAETPTIVTEHQGLGYWCPHCQKFHYAPLPEAVVKAGLFGPLDDSLGRLAEGRLPCLVLYHPQVSPRCGAGGRFPRLFGQAGCQGERVVGRSLCRIVGAAAG